MTFRQRIEIGAIAVGVVALIGVTSMNISSDRKRRQRRQAGWEEMNREAAQDAAPTALRSRVGSALDEETLQEQLEVLKQPWGKDPFAPLGVQPTSVQPGWILRGISISPGKPSLAVINESIVQEGDLVEGHRVERIEPARVILEKGEQELILELPEEDEKGK